MNLTDAVTRQLLKVLEGKTSRTQAAQWALRKIEQTDRTTDDEKAWAYLEFACMLEETDDAAILKTIRLYDGAAKTLPSAEKLLAKLADSLQKVSREEVADWAAGFLPLADALYEDNQIEKTYWALLQYTAGIDDPDAEGNYLFSDEQIERELLKYTQKIKE